MSGNVVYEVNLDVEAAIIEDYRAWLDAHVGDVCRLPGFIDADLYEVIDPASEPGRVALCVQYRMRDAAAFQSYLAEHAPRMREEGEKRFGGRYAARRRVLVHLAREDCDR
ncbi:DUF4286 family protein [Marilutibacter aestuarii]|uniref:DUF4286 family protein n=1 Tax=Marilutibacter aestuarii TaxID=1706195 RepID=A0A508ACN5_9GAMM|nr:DUF4286 family protein [Lysobacter aestuarii]TQD47710.1 DUF4286 family protein [Lysobacter aestuarii]